LGRLPRGTLEVVHRRPRLTLVTVHGGRDAPHTGAARLFVIDVVMVGRGRGPLRVLLVPLFTALDALLSSMDDDVRRRLLATALGHLHALLSRTKLGHLVAGGVLGGDAARLLECVT
jgi:hypothetical protein